MLRRCLIAWTNHIIHWCWIIC